MHYRVDSRVARDGHNRYIISSCLSSLLVKEIVEEEADRSIGVLKLSGKYHCSYDYLKTTWFLCSQKFQ